MSLFKKPLPLIGILTLIYLVAAIILHGTYPHLYLSAFPWMLLFFFFLYFGFAFLLIGDKGDKPARFINRFILFTGIKLFLLFIFILFYLIFVKTEPVLFLAYIPILYSGYSLVTYSAILATGRKNK